MITTVNMVKSTPSTHCQGNGYWSLTLLTMNDLDSLASFFHAVTCKREHTPAGDCITR